MAELTPPMFYFLASLPVRIGAQIQECESGCWEWQGTRLPEGHGRRYWQGRQHLAHRLIYTFLASSIPDGLVLDHLCRNPPCCNPAHLEPVTNEENILRGRRARPWLAVVTPTTRPEPVLLPPAGLGPWLTVLGWPDYKVSVSGEVWSHPRAATRGGILRQNVDAKGRPYVNLTRNGRQKVRRVHQLVAEVFLGGPCPDGYEVCHRDGDPANNGVTNLYYGTHQQNMADLILHGTTNSRKTHCPQNHEYTPSNTLRTKVGGRYCRKCANASNLALYHSKPRPARKVLKAECPQCGSAFEKVFPHHKRKYCDDACYRAFLADERSRRRASAA